LLTAFAIYYEVEVRLYDLLWRCLTPHMDGRLPAGNFSSILGTIVFGKHPDRGVRSSLRLGHTIPIPREPFFSKCAINNPIHFAESTLATRVLHGRLFLEPN
jgi:hypothetical protein